MNSRMIASRAPSRQHLPRRKTEIPIDRPDALTKGFADDPTKIQQWNAFIPDVAIEPGSLAEVIETLAGFPHADKARSLKGD
jgi:hypothetical protein